MNLFIIFSLLTDQLVSLDLVHKCLNYVNFGDQSIHFVPLILSRIIWEILELICVVLCSTAALNHFSAYLSIKVRINKCWVFQVFWNPKPQRLQMFPNSTAFVQELNPFSAISALKYDDDDRCSVFGVNSLKHTISDFGCNLPIKWSAGPEDVLSLHSPQKS